MSEKQKNIQMLVTMLMGGETYEAHHAYSVSATLAAQLVHEKSAKFVRATARDAKPKVGWQATLRPGDAFNWQVTVSLPIFIKPRIAAAYEARRGFPRNRSRRSYLKEVGGNGSNVSRAQAKAIDYLVKNEAGLYLRVLGALARYADQCREAWGLDDRIVPKRMTPLQVAKRIEFGSVCVTRKQRDGMAYVELYGECAWDREHGFSAILHRQRVVDVSQQGAWWSDRRAVK